MLTLAIAQTASGASAPQTASNPYYGISADNTNLCSILFSSNSSSEKTAKGTKNNDFRAEKE